ncbi:DsbA family oxidoreductase [Alteromonas sp. 5E99-2]|uniref:DsbA family oxidoreductase n=1 Tax=Alteromonas sp. 5E99-2 TaxID=2817683 RepID=UPI001A97E902|nr:DsbA family oxidoreductase [Alteromonas sp. 5E99-2]MBO1255968.1 DsbA family oxidoreductase [Alteromonas sp. 5E99-2]
MSQLQIDIISDVSCPWCIVGYKGLEKALTNLQGKLDASIQWHAFELSPDMPKEGQLLSDYMTERYGVTKEQSDQNREALLKRGSDVGFEFVYSDEKRIYNTFDAHRLIFWAKSQGKQTELKLALFTLYFQNMGDPSDHLSLLDTVESVGLDTTEAKRILDGDMYTQEVREEQKKFASMGITSVPSVVVNNKYLIQGGQPADVFEKTLLKISEE